jgi:hypothetical protein
MVWPSPSLVEQIETQVHRMTHHRIRDLVVQEERGHILIRGRVPTYHAKQLALHGALELLPGDRIRTDITVG